MRHRRFYRANVGALRSVEMSHAFHAFPGVDFVLAFPFEYGTDGADGFAGSTVHAGIGNHVGQIVIRPLCRRVKVGIRFECFPFLADSHRFDNRSSFE